ncbi:MAG: phosphoribosylaminoimidazolesuccinocarboxamide synthase [Flavobacterium sp.]|uniref:phosphoribosylaminoimidazolesuccinocarboxamide synthase n=1 Tax=Flavobacterium sp. TaxID=239 RepID=UPI001202B061|nr:phosphoribosylaminoimidazolesuccinocarboxamide synthase [Flavobacterium sp.]RZJ65655.1 MAG: phosphoribosylaminoimidazolesuccinocarboxamide synthase [Flavobacterium sp.]
MILIVYVLLGIFLAYLSVSDFQQRKYPTALMYALVGAYLIYGVIKSRNNSATPVIERKSIQKVNFIQARTGATRACFEVIFKNQKGNLKTRLIFLPGSLSNGKAATDDALRVFKHENLID